MRALALAVLAVAAAAAAALALAGGDDPGAPPRPRQDAVLYGIGVSTDPYGSSRPRGVGVAFGLGRGRPRTAALRRPDLRNVGWLDGGRVAALDFRGGLPRFRALRVGDDLSAADAAAPPGGAVNVLWSPDGRWIAYQRAVPCGGRDAPRYPRCYRPGGRTFVAEAADPWAPPVGVPSGHALGWTPGGRLVMPRRGDLQAVDPRTGRRSVLLSGRAVARSAGTPFRPWFSGPIWSADRRYLAALVHVRHRAEDRVGTVLVATGDGRRIVRLHHSPYTISMLAWAPEGHRLAWTTSGFPDPHELFVADVARGGAPRRVFAAARHFDWVAWSPDGRRLLLDDEHDGDGSWRLLAPGGLGRPQVLDRLGGRPQWCCPQNAFVAVDGSWSAGVRH